MNQPKRINKILGILSHIIFASARFRFTRWTRIPHLASPNATKRGIYHQLQVLEMAINIASGPAELGQGRTPCSGVGRVGVDVDWGGAAWEEPDLDGLGCPLEGVHAA